MAREPAGEVSVTARMVAAWRGRAARDRPDLCEDPWALELAGDEGRAVAARHDRADPHMELWIGVRTAFIDRQVARLTAPPAALPQVVVLGAGLDTRAARFQGTGARFFEVDRPADSAAKQAALARLSDYPLDAATYVGCDFETDDFIERLTAAGYDPARPALFIWEGVTYYLTEAAVRATLDRIAHDTDPGSVVVFDYLRRKAVEARRVGRDLEAMRELVEGSGEPFRFGIDRPVVLLYETGYRQVRTVRFDEACLSYTGSWDPERPFHAQGLVVASRGRPAVP